MGWHFKVWSWTPLKLSAFRTLFYLHNVRFSMGDISRSDLERTLVICSWAAFRIWQFWWDKFQNVRITEWVTQHLCVLLWKSPRSCRLHFPLSHRKAKYLITCKLGWFDCLCKDNIGNLKLMEIMRTIWFDPCRKLEAQKAESRQRRRKLPVAPQRTQTNYTGRAIPSSPSRVYVLAM